MLVPVVKFAELLCIRNIKFLFGIDTLEIFVQVWLALMVMVLLLLSEAVDGAVVVVTQLDPLNTCQFAGAFILTVPFER